MSKTVKSRFLQSEKITLYELAELMQVSHKDAVDMAIKLQESSVFGVITPSVNALELCEVDYWVNMNQALAISAMLDVGVLMDLVGRNYTHCEEINVKPKQAKFHTASLAALKEMQAMLPDESMEWLSIAQIAKINGIRYNDISLRKLKCVSLEIGKPPRLAFDTYLGEVSTYHISVWNAVYPNLKLPFGY